MNFHFMRSRLLVGLLLLILLGGCGTNKNIPYFRDISDSLYQDPKRVSAGTFQDPKIQANDILQVSILTLDAAVNNMLNVETVESYSVQPGAGGTQTGKQNQPGFLVDRNGYIEIPVVGKIKLAGLTTAEARDTIHDKVALFYKDPIVNVRFSNFSITVLGEVARPSTYVVPNEKVSILDAIGMAGDLTIFGKRENVLLIRDTMGQKQFIRFNMNSSKTLQSPFFYLKQGDIVYVEPNKSKAASTDAAQIRNYALLTSLVTIIVTIITRF